MCLLKNDITNGYSDGRGEHGVEGIGILNCPIIGISGECIRDVGGGDQLTFDENIAIGSASSGDKEVALRRNYVPFHLICKNANVDNK